MKISTPITSMSFLFRFAVIVILHYFISFQAAGQTNWNFAAPTDGSGNSGAETGRAICTDAAGNVYTMGAFAGTSDFDLNSASTNTFAAVGSDGYITSYDKNGVLRWKTIISGSVNDFSAPSGAICTNGTDVWITGAVNTIGAPHIISSLSNITIPVTGGGGTNDIFVGKINCSNGDIQWITAFGGSGNNDCGQGICVDPSGNCYAIGAYGGTFTLNSIIAPVSSGASDFFAAKFSTTGTLSWFSAGGAASAADMLANGGGICYVPGATPVLVAVGSYGAGTAAYGTFTGIASSGGNDLMLVELDPATGAFTNAIGRGTAGTDELLGAVYDPISKDVFVAGYFAQTSGVSITLPGTPLMTTAGGSDLIIARYSPTTNNFIWAKNEGGTLDDRASAIAADGLGGLHITGFSKSNPCNFGNSISVNASAGLDDIIAAKYDYSGTALYGVVAGGTSTDDGRGIAAYVQATPPLQSIYITGNYQLTCTFNGTPLVADGGNDFFLARINDLTSVIILPLKLVSFTAKRVNSSSNTLEWKTAEEMNTSKFIVEKSVDGMLFTGIGEVNAAGIGNNSYRFDDLQATTTSYYRLKMEDIDQKYTYSNTLRLTVSDASDIASIFPNPAASAFQLHTPDRLAGTSAILSNANGAELKDIRITGRNMSIDVITYPAGIYFIRLENGQTLKLLKN